MLMQEEAQPQGNKLDAGQQSKKRKKKQNNKSQSKKVKHVEETERQNGESKPTKSQKRALRRQTEPFLRLGQRCRKEVGVSVSELQELVCYVLLVASRPSTPPSWVKIWNVDMIKKLVVVFVSQVGKDMLGNYQRKLKLSKSCLQNDVKLHSGNSGDMLSSLDDMFFQNPIMNETQIMGVQKTHLLLTDSNIEVNDFPIPYSLNQDNGKKDVICIPSAIPATDASPMFAIDCEMCETTEGRELTRISVVDEHSVLIYDSLVMPGKPIVDYKTKYSGITEEKLRGCTTRLSDVQEKLIQILPPDCILIGHSIEFDFRALKFYHRNIIDTSDIYPHAKHKEGFKNSLRYLARVHLKKKIQRGNNGHCSAEDARACMSLVQLKMKNGPPSVKKSIQYENILKAFEKGIHSIRASVIDRADMAEKRCVGCVNAVPCKTDNEVAVKTAEEVQTSSFVWCQLRAMETCLKGHASNEQKELVIKKIDKNIAHIFNSLPPNTLSLVLFGGETITGSEVASSLKSEEKVPSQFDSGNAHCCFHLKL